ncbi:MAG: hypothetical protein HKN70_12805 [Gammaproteobacteria bacterium]|nr:hypothetical protein [Gammaproteobacteria bacterium]
MVSLAGRHVCAVLGVLVMGCGCRSVPPFELSDYHADDQFSWRAEGRLPVLVVKCPAGIGGVMVSGLDRGAAQLMVELHLDGLENLTIRSNRTRYQLEVTQAGRVLTEPVQNNPLILGEIPAKPGVMPWRVRIDLRSYRHHTDAITLSWIDFYR